MAVALPAIRDLLRPGLRDVTGKYPMIPKQWGEVYETVKANLALERTVEMRYLGLAQLKSEGGATHFDNGAGERIVYNQEHMEIALGYAITRKAIDDNQYKAKFMPSNLGLQESFAQTKEIYAANVLNTANVYNPAVGADGVAPLSALHPVDNGYNQNTPTVQTALNETSLNNASILIRAMKNQAGLKVFARSEKLLVPPNLKYVAKRLLETEKRAGTTDNDTNTTAGDFPGGYTVLDFLTSPYAWFVKTNRKGMAYMERVPFETDMWVDEDTDNLKVKGYERYSFGYTDYRALFGAFPTS